jgi:hypothetical protein
LVLNFILSTSFAYAAFSISRDVCDQVSHTDFGNGETLDMDECLDVYLDTAAIATVALALNLLLKVYINLSFSIFNTLIVINTDCYFKSF